MLIGLLGLGSIGSRHGRNLMNLGHQVIAHDPNILSASREDVLQQADAIVIASPTKCHGMDLVDVLRAGKHVLVEKPIGYDSPEFIAGVIAGSKMKNPNIVVATGFNLRFHHCVKKAKEIIDSGWLGPIRSAEFSVLQRNDRPEYLRDGVIRNWMSHEIDLARHLLGNLHVSRSENVTMYKDQDVEAAFNFYAIEHDAEVSISADYKTHPEKREFSIWGRDRIVAVDLVRRTMEWGEMHDLSGKKDHKFAPRDTFDENYIDEMKAFIGAINGEDPGPLADAYDGVAALELVMGCRKIAGLDG